LALNLFFAAGVFYNKLEADRLSAAPERRVAELATLSDEQRAAFLEMAKERGFLRGLYGWRRTRK
jgi:hypothetical protein